MYTCGKCIAFLSIHPSSPSFLNSDLKNMIALITNLLQYLFLTFLPLSLSFPPSPSLSLSLCLSVSLLLRKTQR